MTVDFGNVSDKKVTADNTAEFDLFDIDMEEAVLIVAPATRSNKAYNTAQMNLMLPQQRRISGGKMNAAFLDKYREDIKPMFATHVLKGWTNVVDRTGKAVPFSTENAFAFLQALPSSTFDALTEFCENEGNFRVAADPDLAKN